MMANYSELDDSWEDMLKQNKLYQPSNFWREASNLIKSEIKLNGVEKFRSLESILSYFAPTYGIPGNSFTREMVHALLNELKSDFPGEKKPKLALEQFLSGYMSALGDYRVLLASDNVSILPFIHLFSESDYGDPIEHFEFDGRKFSRSSLNYLLGLAMLKKHLDGDVPQTILEIGGGFGTLGEILSKSGIKGLHYIDIDIPPTSYVAQNYLTYILGVENVATYNQYKLNDSISIDSLPMASVFCSWQIEKLIGKIDLFVNFISFQEMEPEIVQNYLKHVSRLSSTWILLRNIREGKNIRTDKCLEGVEIPIFSDDYVTMLPDYELIERNVIPFGYRTVDNFHSELLLLKRKHE